MTDSKKDPVCGMQIDRAVFVMEHLGIAYAFCSQQCQDRFRTNPHLYIGIPGEKAPKQQGVEVIKQRHFRLEQPLTTDEAAIVQDGLGALMGIKRIEVAGDTISIAYDLLQATAEQIEQRIGQLGVSLGASLAERLQRGFIHYFEECEIGNLEVTPKSGHH